jgi:NTP pyrophosphatase (non-canonical NTP hydrolase)
MTEDTLMDTNTMPEQNSLDRYQQFTPTTNVVPLSFKIAYLETGLASEVGELLGAAAKFYRGDYDEAEFMRRTEKEIGDIMYFLSEYANQYNLNLNLILNKNKKKLQDRLDRGVIKGDGETR